MNSTRKIAVITGVIFIIATVTSLLASAITPALTGTDYLAQISAHANQVAGGALLYIIAAFTSVGVAIALYPVLKERNASLALGSVAFRALEAAFYMIAVVSRLSLLTLSKQYAAAGTADRAWLQAIGDALVGVHDHAALLAVFAFGLGAFMYYYLFFQSRLIPRWLSGVGDYRDHLDAGSLRDGPVQRQAYHRLHSPGVSHFPARNGSGRLADRQGVQSVCKCCQAWESGNA